MDRMFDTYGGLLPALQAHLAARHPRPGDGSDVAWRQSVRAAALDAARGILPAGALSNVGIYGSGQSYELLVMRLRSCPLPEARRYGELVLEELLKVVPSFLSRVDRPERGGAWTEYLRRCQEDAACTVAELWPPEAPEPGSGVRLVGHDPAGEEKNLPAAELTRRVATMSACERERLARAYVGERRNRRHRPGRAFEATSYRFEVVSDYGAFRDLQRHRMLTIEWQPLSTDLGYSVPDVVGEAGLDDAYVGSLERSKALHDALAPYFPEQAAYAVALGFNVRYVMEMSAREAMHVIELRSGPEGHPAYRRIAQAMHRLIAEQAGHRLIAGSMRFVDFGEDGLGRLTAEERRQTRGPGGPGEEPSK
jgi:thymidylate synthase ThyX